VQLFGSESKRVTSNSIDDAREDRVLAVSSDRPILLVVKKVEMLHALTIQRFEPPKQPNNVS
jgi:hypothetical protein